jgi:O-acetyl-ADP-ribose deacetylase (regulator of RNase III)
MAYNEINGNLITLAYDNQFDVIAHGCNCLSTMGAGLAPQMAKAFGCDKFPMELMGPSINKLGCIDYKLHEPLNLIVVNAYTQFYYGKNHTDGITKPLDYEALTLCLRKMNTLFKFKKIGLPQIGAGLAGGDWNLIKSIIIKELHECNTTVVIFKPPL